MNISRVFAAAAIAASVSLCGAQAQSVKNGLVPAEFPPTSYKGRQYVDSKGCVFIRAGIDGNVTWVPRVTRSRKVICGFQPTFAKSSQPAAATAPVAVAATPKATPKTVTRTKAKPAQPVRANAAPVRGEPACQGGNAVSQAYVGRVGEGVRCGPQQGFFAPRAAQPAAHRNTYATYRQPKPARVVPRHVYESQTATSQPAITIPKGYKPAWDDDRLNPQRAHQTMAGKAKMDQIWSETLPRKLIGHDASSQARSTKSGEFVTVGATRSALSLSTRSSQVKTSTRQVPDR